MPSTITSRLEGLTASVAVKAPCRLKTTANHALSGLAAIGATTPVAGDRILVASQTTASQNGIWVAASGAWTRALDFNGSLDVVTGTMVFVTVDGAFWRISTTGEIIIGTTSIAFASAPVAFVDAITPQQFGAVADDVTDDSAAFVAALAYLKSTAINTGTTRASLPLYVPRGKYYMGTTTLDITHALHIYGDTPGNFGGRGTEMRWAHGATGIRTQTDSSSGASGGVVATGHFGAFGTLIENLSLIGGFVATEGEFHAIHLRAKSHIRDCYIDGWSGDGVFIKAAVGSGVYNGNANGSLVENVAAIRCRNGLYVEGVDTNGIIYSNFNTNSNRQYGKWLKENLCNTIVGGDDSTNGSNAALPAFTSRGYQWYYVLPNQEAGASTNAPKSLVGTTITIASPGVVTWASHGLTAETRVRFSTTGALPTGLAQGTTYYVIYVDANTFQLALSAADAKAGTAINTSGTQSGVHTIGAYVTNTWWAPMNGPGQVAVEFPAWVTGMTWRAGGSIRIEGIGNSAVLLNPYLEGDQPPIQCEGKAMVFAEGASVSSFTGAQWGGHMRGDSAALYALLGMNVLGNLTARSAAYFGPENTDAPLSPIVHYRTNETNGSFTQQFEWRGNIRGSDAFFEQNQILRRTLANAAGLHYFRIGSTDIAEITANGLGYATGGAVTQITSRTTGVTLNTVSGAITLVSAAGSASWQTFTVTNSKVAATDTVLASQKSGTDLNMIEVTAVGAGSFNISFATTGGTTVEQPVFNFAIIKGKAA